MKNLLKIETFCIWNGIKKAYADHRSGGAMRFKAVIFDLDGTLLNTLCDIAESANQVLLKYGYPQNPIEQYKYLVGKGVRNLILNAIEETVTEDRLECIISDYKDIYSKRFCEKTSKYAGIDSLLDHLDELGILYAILSNKPHNLTCRSIAHYFPNRNFQAIVGQQDNIPMKPNPDSVRGILDCFRCKANETMFIGDSGVDMETAKNANMFGVGVLWGYREKEELLSHGAKKLVAHPSDILELIDGG